MLTKSIAVNKIICVTSTLTGRPYLDGERMGYIFFSEDAAEDFINTHPASERSGPFYTTPEEIMSRYFAAGAETVKIDTGDRTETVDLYETTLKKRYYNNELNACIALFKQTHLPEYLKKLAAYEFIIPARIKEEYGEQKIVYATMHADDIYVYIAFSDLEEYEEWAGELTGWQPLVVNFDVMCQIAKEHGYVINPVGNHLKLPGDKMEKYREYSL